MKVSGIFFALVIVSFFLPFLMVTCNGQELYTYTGLQLATGSQIKSSSLDPAEGLKKSMKGLDNIFDISDDEQQQDDPAKKEDDGKTGSGNFNFAAALALLTAVLGLILAFALKPSKYKVTLILAILGIAFMILLFITANAQAGKAQKEMEGMINIELKLKLGFYLTCLWFILAAAASVLIKKPQPAAVTTGGLDDVAAPLPTFDMAEPEEDEENQDIPPQETQIPNEE